MSEKHSEAHRLLRSAPGNENRSTAAKNKGEVHGITHPGSTGVIYVMDRAEKNGYTPESEEWANFGQGAPEGNPLFSKKMSCLLIFIQSVILMAARNDLVKLIYQRRLMNMPLPLALKSSGRQ